MFQPYIFTDETPASLRAQLPAMQSPAVTGVSPATQQMVQDSPSEPRFVKRHLPFTDPSFSRDAGSSPTSAGLIGACSQTVGSTAGTDDVKCIFESSLPYFACCRAA